MEIGILSAFVAVGIVSGIVAGLLGLSGGVIAVPSLVLIFNFVDLPQEHLMHVAIGTSLAAMVINGVASTIAHHRRNSVMWDVVVALIPGLFLGCLLGSFVASYLSSIVLQVIFGIFVCCLGAYVLLQKKRGTGKKHRTDRAFYTWIGLGIGFIASILGIGGGVFMVPFLLSHEHSEKKAIGTSAAMGLFVTFLASMGYLYFGLQQPPIKGCIGYIYLPAFIAIGTMTIFFAPIGAKLAHQTDPKKLRRIFSGALVLIGIFMIFN